VIFTLAVLVQLELDLHLAQVVAEQGTQAQVRRHQAITVETVVQVVAEVVLPTMVAHQAQAAMALSFFITKE
jgi:hypothetical protein